MTSKEFKEFNNSVAKETLETCKEFMDMLNVKNKKINLLLSKAHGKLTNQQVIELKYLQKRILDDAKFLSVYSSNIRTKYKYYKDV